MNKENVGGGGGCACVCVCDMEYIYNKILFILKKEGSPAIFNNLDESGGPYAQ